MQHCQNHYFEAICSGNGILALGPLEKIGALLCLVCSFAFFFFFIFMRASTQQILYGFNQFVGHASRRVTCRNLALVTGHGEERSERDT
jgi:hypothetical protein